MLQFCTVPLQLFYLLFLVLRTIINNNHEENVHCFLFDYLILLQLVKNKSLHSWTFVCDVWGKIRDLQTRWRMCIASSI